MFKSVLARSLRVPVSRSAVTAKPLAAFNQIKFYSGFPALTRDLAKERIIELLEGYDKVKNPEKISEGLSFSQDLGLDSLDVVEVVMEVEHEFNIEIPDAEADSLKTVGQTIDYIVSQPDAC